VLALSLELTSHHLAHNPASPPASVQAPVAILVLLAFGTEGIWRLVRHLGVIAHEGAHAVAGWGTGHKVSGVQLNSDATGETVIPGTAGLSAIITGFAGYLGPSLFGLGAAALLAHHQVEAVLVVAGIFLFIILLLVRNFFGVFSVLVTGGLIVLVLWSGSLELQTITAYAVSWFLLLSGVRFVFMHGSGADDAHSLRKITHIPRMAWATLWLVGTVTALWIGGRILI
jgi:Peptidase M50B-like